MVLFLSVRRNGASLGEIVKKELGPVPDTIVLFGCFLIMIIILAVLALIVVKALAESPWGVFTVCSTVPIALFMGIYMRYLRPGRVAEVSVIGIGIVILDPDLKMPAVTQFVDGTGPVWKGTLFPFLFITIACGAVSGFHALIASGTTPKLLRALSVTAQC